MTWSISVCLLLAWAFFLSNSQVIGELRCHGFDVIPDISARFQQNHSNVMCYMHDDVIKWKHFPRNWPFVRGFHRSPVNSPHKGQWRGTLMFSLIYTRINGWVNNDEAGDLRRHGAHYDITVIWRYFHIAHHISDETLWNISRHKLFKISMA